MLIKPNSQQSSWSTINFGSWLANLGIIVVEKWNHWSIQLRTASPSSFVLDVPRSSLKANLMQHLHSLWLKTPLYSFYLDSKGNYSLKLNPNEELICREEESESCVLGGRRPDGVPPDNGGRSRIRSGGRCRRWMEHFNPTGEWGNFYISPSTSTSPAILHVR